MDPMDNAAVDADADLDDGYDDPPESVPPSDIDVMEVYCLDETIALDGGTDAYTETPTDVSDELIASGEAADNAEAVEIMATNATGATNSENQNVVWALITSLSGGEFVVPGDLVGDEVKVYDAVLALATDFNAYNTANPATPITLEQFLENEGINDLDVYLGTETPELEFIGSDGTANNGPFEATAIMAEPLVPEVTDGTAADPKNVFWYILGGSYNVSFASGSLLTATTADMVDAVDLQGAADGGVDADLDGKDEANDHYGISTVPYFFYWWGDEYPEFEEMNANIGAVVDIDEDGKIDLHVSDLPSFNTNAKVVDVTAGEVNKIAGTVQPAGAKNPVPDVATSAPTNIDIDYYNAGKILTTLADGETFDDYNMQDVPEEQRFVIESYSEPGQSAMKFYSRWIDLKVTKTDSVDDTPIPGAVYGLHYVSGGTNPNNYPYIAYFEETTNASGVATFPMVSWGYYSLM